ncbi:MAG TPA: VWA domain-containing protein [Thermoanaerobaculia bacterium]|nr:VWA domain-containing protein [Thermoanaerobaculia bacterium]
MPVVLLILLVFLASPSFAQSTEPDPLLWPEAQRAFLEDGPALLLSPEQRAAFMALDEAGRDQFIQDFLRDPIPGTPENELQEGIERRQLLALRDYSLLQDARAQLLFLKGRPVSSTVIDCAVIFQPIEIWTYPDDAALHDLVLYRPAPDEPFRLWLPIDSKQALYTDDAAAWLEDWERLGRGGTRIDRRFCKQGVSQVDRATGIDGLKGLPVLTASFSSSEEPKMVRWVRPRDRASFLAGPKDLAAWARMAALTPLPAPKPSLRVDPIQVDFPRWQGQRLVARALLTLPAEGLHVTEEEKGKPRVRLTVDGVVEHDGRVFESFRMRYQFAPPGKEEPATLLLEYPLRPGQGFLLRLRLTDEASSEGFAARGFRVPGQQAATLPSAVMETAVRGNLTEERVITAADTLLLLPPPGDVVLGTWRAETVATGERIAKVVFLVDGETQLTRTRPPYSAEVRLATFPREQVVRVEGYDAAGELVAADQVVLNQARGAFRVTITEPGRGRAAAGKLLARAEVTIPEERKIESVEFRINDELVTVLRTPPWQHTVEVPGGSDLAYLSVVAFLDDGSRAEDVRFLRTPENLEEVEVDLVELFTTVTDSSGHPVKGLADRDFEILENGRPQTIARFEQVENLPLNLGIAIDTSFSMASSLDEAHRAAAGFLRAVVTPKDRCFALAFATRPALLIPPVDDAEAVALSLEEMRAFGRTALHDAIINSLYYFRGQRGQRALVLLTDGDDTGSSTSWEDALEFARRSGVAIYTIGLDIPELKFGPRGKLSELAQVSGGRAFFIDRADELSGVYEQIEDELRSRYFLTYNSGERADENGFRKIEVKVKRGLKARTGRGYYP